MRPKNSSRADFVSQCWKTIKRKGFLLILKPPRLQFQHLWLYLLMTTAVLVIYSAIRAVRGKFKDNRPLVDQLASYRIAGGLKISWGKGK